MQSLVSQMVQCTRATLEDMHTRVNNEVSSRYEHDGNKQIPQVRTNLRKAVYFLC